MSASFRVYILCANGTWTEGQVRYDRAFFAPSIFFISVSPGNKLSRRPQSKFSLRISNERKAEDINLGFVFEVKSSRKRVLEIVGFLRAFFAPFCAFEIPPFCF